jgi:uncharacterized SAM-binding protein YcdF (DUF218 family)/glycosyltransferase involved in cell wall biosynthesis
MSVSVLILTRNEEVSLPACLRSVEWSDDIVVFDSFSDDRTVEIAKAAGARVYQRVFDNERDHRIASLQLPFAHPWVYNPDADEITPPELRDEILRVIADCDRPETAYRVRFKTIFCGTWIKYSSLYPTWVVRLFQPGRIAFERSVNLRYLIDGHEGRLQNHFEHHAFNKGIGAWLAKHNDYSASEAAESLKSLSAHSFKWTELLSISPVHRRRALKELSFRLPFRPTLRFVYMYIFRRGFLDGRPGFDYCVLLGMYEQMIVLKMKELQRGNVAAQSVEEIIDATRFRCFLLSFRTFTYVASLFVVLVILAFAFSKNLLCIDSGPAQAQVIIILGGEGAPRALQALKLFRAGAAPSIIVSGDGDADLIAQQLIQAGVPAPVIEVERLSRNTKENAEFTTRLLKKRGIDRALIVTSWFHSRRALNSFSFFAPAIRFSSEPTYAGQAAPTEAVHIYQEYLKTIWYFFRYGISPWRN